MDKRRINWSSLPIRIIAVAAIAAAAGVCIFFVWTLTLRSEYKRTAQEINQAILSARDRGTITFDGTETPVTFEVLNYYDMFLTDKYTLVYSREGTEPTDERLDIHLLDELLSLQKLEDGSATLITWQSGGETKTYRVRSLTTYMQLQAYFENYKRKLPE